MDFSNFKVGDWLLVAGGVVMLLFGLALPWASYAGESGNHAFDYFFTGGIAWLLVVGAGVVAVLLVVGVIQPSGVPWPVVLLAATGLATLLMLVRLLLGAGDVSALGISIEFDRGPGMFVAFVAAAVALGGAVMNFTAAGGTLKELTDFDKLRSSFGHPGSQQGAPPPPPPSGGGSMPPPPPPQP